MRRKGKYGKKISFETIRENKTLDGYDKEDYNEKGKRA